MYDSPGGITSCGRRAERRLERQPWRYSGRRFDHDGTGQFVEQIEPVPAVREAQRSAERDDAVNAAAGRRVEQRQDLGAEEAMDDKRLVGMIEQRSEIGQPPNR